MAASSISITWFQMLSQQSTLESQVPVFFFLLLPLPPPLFTEVANICIHDQLAAFLLPALTENYLVSKIKLSVSLCLS